MPKLDAESLYEHLTDKLRKIDQAIDASELVRHIFFEDRAELIVDIQKLEELYPYLKEGRQI